MCECPENLWKEETHVSFSSFLPLVDLALVPLEGLGCSLPLSVLFLAEVEMLVRVSLMNGAPIPGLGFPQSSPQMSL